MEGELVPLSELFGILCGIVVGTLARAVTLRVDMRQNPSYPNGVFINLVTGFLAACLGAVAIPALLEKNYTAVTFLALGVQHFREIRKMERDSLESLDRTEYHPRGDAYIDGIAKTYEARNYISLLAAFFAVLAAHLADDGGLLAQGIAAAVVGAGVTLLLYRFTRGKQVGDIADISLGHMEVRGSALYVDGIFVTNTLGSESSSSFVQEKGIAVVVTPHAPADRLTLENYGQRQAMLFEAIRSHGVRRYRFTRRDFGDGRIALAFVPIVEDSEGILAAVRHTPVLESSSKRL